ncbi:OFA family MFS transporter [Desulfovibrio sp. OttesenSCG-928-C14]|nr:OFA family MFS transporter [Desulfovibrio sp. OttesenSCG-928-C14]
MDAVAKNAAWRGTPRAGWLTLAGSVLCMLALGAAYTWSLFNQPLAAIFHWRIEDVAFTFALISVFLALGTLFSGWLEEKCGIRAVTAGGGLVLALGFFLASRASALWQLYLCAGVLVGLCEGAVYMLLLTNCIKWFPRSKGLVAGIYVGSYGIGSILFKHINLALLESLGPLDTFACLAVIMALACLIASLMIRPAPLSEEEEPSLAVRRAEPAQPASLDSSGSTAMRAGPALDSVSEVLPGRVPQHCLEDGADCPDLTWREMIRTKEAWLLFFIMLSCCMSGLFLVSVARDLATLWAGLDTLTAAGAVTVVAVANTLGRILLGRLSDLVPRMRIISANTLGIFLSACVLAFAPLNSFVFFLCMGVIAFGFGGTISTFPALTGEFFGLRHMSKNYSLIYQGFGAGAFAGSFLSVLLGGFFNTFILIMVLSLISFVITLRIRKP